MNAKSIFAVSALVGLLVVGACGSPKGGKSLTVPYAISMPEGWSNVEDTPYNLQYVSPQDDMEDGFRAYIRVDTMRPPGRANPDALPSNWFLQHPEEFDDHEEVSDEMVEVKDWDSCRYVFTWQEDGATRKAVAWFFIYKATALVVMGVATPETFDSYLPTFEEAIQTLEMDKP